MDKVTPRDGALRCLTSITPEMSTADVELLTAHAQIHALLHIGDALTAVATATAKQATGTSLIADELQRQRFGR